MGVPIQCAPIMSQKLLVLRCLCSDPTPITAYFEKIESPAQTQVPATQHGRERLRLGISDRAKAIVPRGRRNAEEMTDGSRIVLPR